LVARALSRLKPEVWLAEARQHFWFEPEWVEVLTLLAALTDDPTPLIDAVDDERTHDDIFGSMLALKARMVGAARKLDPSSAHATGQQVFKFWMQTLRPSRDAFRLFSTAMFPLLAAKDA